MTAASTTDCAGAVWSPARLRAAGRPVPSTRGLVEWRLATRPEEIEAVVRLRQLAYVSAGKVPVDRAPRLTDDLDGSARLVAAWAGPEVVASLRVIPPAPGVVFEVERRVRPWAALPELPPRSDTAEVTRVCTHPDWRGSDLLVGLFQQCVLEVLRIQCRYLVGYASRNLLRLYTRMGCRPTATTFVQEDMNRELDTVFWGDVLGGVSGRSGPRLAWVLVLREVMQQAVREGLIPPPRGGLAVRNALWSLTGGPLRLAMRLGAR